MAPGGVAGGCYFTPLARRIWLGAVVMFLGGLLARSGSRLRVGAPRKAEVRTGPMPAE